MGTKQEFQFVNILQKVQNNESLSACDIKTLKKCGYILKDDMLFCTHKHSEINVYRTIFHKVQKLEQGIYDGFQKYGLFMFLSETIENISIDDIIKIFKKIQKQNKFFSEIYIFSLTDLYVYNFDTEKLDIIDFSLKMKKFRKIATNKQMNYKKRKCKEKMKIFYIGDQHFGHGNLNCSMDKRGFASVEEMDEYMIKQWNKKVGKDDTVVILGDFSFYDGTKTNEILLRLNGKKILIEGNHDYYLKDKNFNKNLFQKIRQMDEIYDDGRKVVLCHTPNIFYNGQYRKNPDGSPKTYMLYGHIHNSQDDELMKELLKVAKNFTFSSRNGQKEHIPFNLINVFCKKSDYAPLTLNEWIELEKSNMN